MDVISGFASSGGTPAMRNGQRSLTDHTLWMFRHLIFGSFIGAYRARRGLGLPKSPVEWDAEYRMGSLDYLEGLAERSHHMVILKYILGLKGRRRVLDVGCGTGGLLELGRNFPLSIYHGLDASDVAIARARQRFKAKAPGFEVRFEVADFEWFTPKGRYDAIVFNESLTYARDPVSVLERFQCLLSGRRFCGLSVLQLVAGAGGGADNYGIPHASFSRSHQ